MENITLFAHFVDLLFRIIIIYINSTVKGKVSFFALPLAKRALVCYNYTDIIYIGGKYEKIITLNTYFITCAYKFGL